MAEMHPILWSRITNRRLTHDKMKVVNLTTYGNMSSDIADIEIIMAPSGDLAIQNYIAREIVKRDAIDWDFVNKHTVFATGPYDIGYGFRINLGGFLLLWDIAWPTDLKTLGPRRTHFSIGAQF